MGLFNSFALALGCLMAAVNMAVAEQTVTQTLRAKLFVSSSKNLGINTFTPKHKVWGVVVDMGFPKDTVSVVAPADGTTGIYFLKGGGAIIGGGQHASVRKAVAGLIRAADDTAGAFSPATVFPASKLNHVQFYALVKDGVLGTKPLSPQKLEAGSGAMRRFYVRAHEVIARMREMEQKSRGN